MNSMQEHIAPHLTQEQMLGYLKEELSPLESNAVEKHLLDCDLCAEAMEGIEQFDPDMVAGDIDVLKTRIMDRSTSKSGFNYRFYGIAAAIVLVIVSTFVVINNQNQDNLPAQNEVAQEIDGNLSEESSGEQDEILSEPEISENLANSTEPTELKEPEVRETITENKPEQSLAIRSEEPEKKPEPEPIALLEAEEMEDAEMVEEELKTDEISPAAGAPAVATSAEPVQPTIEKEISSDSINEVLGFADAIASTDKKDVENARNAQRKRAVRSKAQSLETSPTTSVFGKIYSENGNPVIGATVVLKGTSIGAVSNQEGNFLMEIPEGNQTLEISLVGLVSLEIRTGGQDSIEIEMQEEDLALSEVVVLSPTESFDQIRVLPRPTDGRKSFKKYLDENLNYPEEARENAIEGRVTLNIEFNEFGIIKNIRVVKGLGYGCDEEAVRLIKEGPLWEPGTVEGKPTEMDMTMRIRFKL